MVIGVQGHVVGVALGCDEAWVAVAGEIEEDVREGNGDAGCELAECAHVWPSRWEVQVFGHD